MTDAPENLLVVSFHTGGAYAPLADRLRASLSAVGVRYVVAYLPDRGNWQANCLAKPGFLQALRARYPGRPLLWVDADAIVHADPRPHLAALGECDAAVHRFRGREVLSGTVYLAATESAGWLLGRWWQCAAEHPDRWDQKALAAAIDLDRYDRPSPTIAELPAELCCIHDLQRKLTPGIRPVIEHFQQSRKTLAAEAASRHEARAMSHEGAEAWPVEAPA